MENLVAPPYWGGEFGCPPYRGGEFGCPPYWGGEFGCPPIWVENLVYTPLAKVRLPHVKPQIISSFYQIKSKKNLKSGSRGYDYVPFGL